MAKNPHSHAEELRTRVDLVRRYRIRGIKTAEEIEEQFRLLNIDCSKRSIYRYISIVKDEGAKAIQEREGLNKDISELAWELREIIDEVTRELWKQYHAPVIIRAKCPHPEHRLGNQSCGLEAEIKLQWGMVKIQALKEIRAAAKDWVEMTQDLGLTYKAPIKTQMIGANGEVVDPTINVNIDKAVVSQEFISFIKAKYQNPVGTKNPVDAINKDTIPAELRPEPK